MRIIEAAFARLPRPRRVRHDQTVLGGVPTSTCAPVRPANDVLAGTHVLFLHGGAFIFCGPATHRGLCSRLAETLGAGAERELLEHDILAFTRRLHEAGTPVETHRWRRGTMPSPSWPDCSRKAAKPSR